MPRATKTCQFCGVVFEKYVNATMWATRKFCSRICQSASSKARAAAPRAVCSVDGCAATVRSAGASMCEKHYGQVRRNGYTGPKGRPVVIHHSEGYLLLEAPLHQLTTGSGTYRVYDHRAAFMERNGNGPFKCHWCDALLTWDGLCIARLNGDKHDNSPANLVAACRRHRTAATDKLPRHYRRRRVEWRGVSKTLQEWSDQLGLPAYVLRNRLRVWPTDLAMTAPLGTRVRTRSDAGVKRPHRRKLADA